MTPYTKSKQTIFKFQNKPLQATFYQPTHTQIKTVLLYFHGGGFVFGSRHDLPKAYVEHLAAAGIGVLAIDYPLAPETKLPVLRETTHQMTKWFVEQFLPENNIETYFIFGRSAGAYLALENGVYTEKLPKRPLGIVSLYGYFNLNDAAFTVPNRYYLQYPKVKEKIVANQIQKEPLFKSTDQNRIFVYIAARQKGDWMDLVTEVPADKKEFSIAKDSLKNLPPLFLAAAKKDPDVPSRQSRQLANLHDEATLHLVDNDEHDFDRTQVDTLGIDLYEQIAEWILDIVDI